MRNLLATLLLLTSTFAFSQAAYLNMTTSDVSNIAVGDTLQVTVKNTNMQSTPSLAQFDIEFNNQLLNHVGTTYPVTSNGTNSSAQTALSTFTGYKWSDGTNLSGTVISQQYNNWGTNGSGYSTSTNLTVLRTTIQDGQTITTDSSHVTFSFVVKDRASTNYTNYSSIVELNWGRLVDNSSNTSYDVHTQAGTISLTNVAGVNAGTVTINVNSPHSNKDKMTYKIYESTQLENNIPKSGESPAYSGNFDSNGQFQSTALSLDATYYIEIESADGGSGWMNNIVTVTDAYKAFQYAIATDINGYESSTDIPTATGTADYHYAGLMADFGVAANNYETKLFTVTETVKTFNFGHAFKGDLDFSHSTEPTATAAKQDNFTVSSIINPNTGKAMTISNSSTPDENYILDISSAIVDGKVELTVNLNTTGLVGSQFNIVFDNTILAFESIKYDTGNEMTDFSRVKDNKLWIGSLDYNGQKEIKTGTPYIVTFNMIQTVQNTAGLINYTITEGVKANGTKVNFNIQ